MPCWECVAVNTNDAFVGIDSDMIGTTKVFPPAFDAGKLYYLAGRPNPLAMTLAQGTSPTSPPSSKVPYLMCLGQGYMGTVPASAQELLYLLR